MSSLRLISRLAVLAIASSVFLLRCPFSPSGRGGAWAQDAPHKAWYMAGANPERTSWVSEEVRGSLQPVWFRPFESYISQKIQVVAANDTLYVSTANGLYALDAATGAQKWVYPTQMPLGHSPTVTGGVVYVGGFDRKIHAIDALTGAVIWTFEASRGFHTNPLVAGGVVYAGNRDGSLYAVTATGGRLLWRFRTDGPILYSAAYKDGVVFFASNDSHAYAVNAITGDLVWKSAKLPGSGFRSWWPVVYRDYVILAGSHNYKHIGGNTPQSIHTPELQDIYPNRVKDAKGTYVGPIGQVPGDWVTGTPTIDTSKSTVTANGSTTPVTEYFERKPWRRTYFVLNRFTGQEATFDSDGDGKPEYAPILWAGTHSGNRYPPVIGYDGVPYQQDNYMSDPYIPGGHISGWKIGTPVISVPMQGGWEWNAVDEPIAHSGGGRLIYYSNCCDRVGGWIDLTRPGAPQHIGFDTFYTYNIGYGTSLVEKIPGYNQFYYLPRTDIHATFGRGGPYGWHADSNPPIPYKGRLYMIRSNAVVALADTSVSVTALPPTRIVQTASTVTIPLRSSLQDELATQVQRIVSAGHLRPGYVGVGLFDFSNQCGDSLSQYWHSSAETIYTLVRAYPGLSDSLKAEVKTYLEKELSAFPPHEYNHMGWSGAAREVYDVPPEVDMSSFPQIKEASGFLWRHTPFTFYALWKYAEVFGSAKTLFDASRSSLDPVPTDAQLLRFPHAHNVFIAGYLGYLRLEALAGYPESTPVRLAYERLLSLRATTFSKDSAYSDCEAAPGVDCYCNTLNAASNFMFLVPELAAYLRARILPQLQDAVQRYSYLAPYWFVSNAEEAFGENAIAPVYDTHALFQARAMLLNEPFEALVRYIDVPAVATGDLYYIQNLVAALEAQSVSAPLPPRSLRINQATQ